MSFGLLTPLFLAGLAAIAVPVLVHLVRREERDSIVFPSLMFLEHMPVRERRRRTIRHWALLALRCAIVALLCAAFARPFLDTPAQAAAAGEERRDRVVVLDRSYSMVYGGRWERAAAAAREAIDTLERGDRGALVLFDHDIEVASRLSARRDALLAALSAAEPGRGHTNLAGAVEHAGRLLAASDAATREVVVISDFQRSALADAEAATLPPGVALVPQAVAGGVGANAAVARVEVKRPREGVEGAVRLVARVVHGGAGTTTGPRDLRLEVNGREVERRPLDLSAGAAHEESFDVVVDPGELSMATVRLDDDALAADNAFHLVLGGPPTLAVLLLQDDGTDPGQSFHLRRALAQGAEPAFGVSVRAVGEVSDADFAAADVVIVNDAPIPGGRAGESLRRFLELGGGMLVVAGPGVRGSWPGGSDGIVPGALGAQVAPPGAMPVRLLDLDEAHPALAAFGDPRGGDLASAEIHRYRALERVAAEGVVARYDDGGVALAERPIGRGRVMVVTTTLDTSWSTLPLVPGYLPLVHGAATYLADFAAAPAAFALGEAVDLGRYASGVPGKGRAAQALAQGTAAAVRTPSGARLRLASGDPFLRLSEPGFYEVHVSGGGARPLVLAANTPRRESSLAPGDPQAFAARISRAGAPAAPESRVEASSAPTTQRREGWWFILLACVVLLAAETLVSNRLSERETAA